MSEAERMTVSRAVEKMLHVYEGSLHDIQHFMKVWAYAKAIGELEGLDADTQRTLELAAIVHDIACPLCRAKYGHVNGPQQEQEGVPLAQAFFAEAGLPDAQLERIAYLVGHHHTLEGVEGLDYRILLEADFLVNADECRLSKEEIRSFRDRVFRTQAGIRLLGSMYGV